MALYAIGDLHLSLTADKPMEVFGPAWENYTERIGDALSRLTAGDVLVLAGDTSWAMKLEDCSADFAFLQNLPGRKLLLKGNHDYWWTTKKKMEDFFAAEGCTSIKILHNNHYRYGEYGICGTRGWVNMPGETQDEKVLRREVQRLETSIRSALDEGLKPIVFLHYPPIFATNFNYDILDVLYRYKIEECYYGHIHGKAHQYAFEGVYEETKMHLISGDYIQFKPVKIV